MNNRLLARCVRFLFCALLLLGLAQPAHLPTSAASQLDILGPSGSGWFGSSVIALPNGNFVVTDPKFDSATAVDVGAVYLYNGATRALISTLTGSTANDQVGLGGVRLLSNGNYVVISYYWNNGAVSQAGAVTWCSADTGCSGEVSALNSLVGSTSQDRVGSPAVTVLTNGSFVVSAAVWDNGTVVDAGAITWCSGAAGCSGVVSAANSLVGSATGDFCSSIVGWERVFPLANGNYVADNFCWDNGAISDAGAVTWCSGNTGCTGTVSPANSLVGGSAGDSVGNNQVYALTNGNYVVGSNAWDNGAVVNVGAVTWCSGTAGCTGAVSVANSLVGSTAEDAVGWSDKTGVTPLTNGNYVVSSPSWDNGAIVDAGAVTWANGVTGIHGTLTIANSLVGSTAEDEVGGGGVIALSYGNYVAGSPHWTNGAIQDVGAATWGNGSTGTVGAVSSANSLVGSTQNDYVTTRGMYALTNGNYVVCSGRWHNGAIYNAGAATWGDGVTGTVGVISAANSLVGGSAENLVCWGGVAALANGNYVVLSYAWDNGAMGNAGAATWCNGSLGCNGVITSANSLVGASADNRVSEGGVTALGNGHYVVDSPWWDNAAINDVGAATWCSGSGGCAGDVSPGNSLIGSTAANQVGLGGVMELSDGNYVVKSIGWDNGATSNAGAVTWADGALGITGTIDSGNSVIGNAVSCGGVMAVAFDAVHDQLLIGRRCENRVTVFWPGAGSIYLPLATK